MKKWLILLTCLPSFATAQVGEHRNLLSVGVNGGYTMSNVSFVPTVLQKQHGGLTGGFTLRYVCEKYFKTICSVQAEVNYTQAGWKEDIIDGDDNPVTLPDGTQKQYARTVNYLQIPVFAHLAWGREERGAQFFFQVGPQIGVFLNESTQTNFPLNGEYDGRSGASRQDTMSVENNFDYGIAAGIGMEHTLGKNMRVVVEGRYYYGLGNLYGDSKRDYFGRSNLGNIIIKLALLFDLKKR